MRAAYLPVRDLSAEDLHARLVEDAVAGVLTPLGWAMLAYEKIGEVRGCGADAAYQFVRAEVNEKRIQIGKPPGMPVA